MGSKSSTLAEIDDNELLCALTGNERKEREDKFWKNLLEFSFDAPEDRDGSKILDESIEKLCKKIASNNHVTGNFTTLVGVFVYHAQNLFINPKKIESFKNCREAHNALLLIRCICKYFVDNLPEQELIRQFNTLPICEGTRTVFEEFLLNLFGIICKVPIRNSTYYLHLETVYTLITLLSVQMQEMRPTASSVIHLSIMNSKCSESATMVVQKLLLNYVKNDALPCEDEASGIISRTFSTVWSLFGGGPETDPNVLRPLANHSLLLLLILANQLTKDRNPYRDIMFEYRGQKDREKGTVDSSKLSNGNAKKPQDMENTRLNFNRLFRAICRDVLKDQAILLLYLMLHRNEHFMNHILQRNDLGNLVLPLLEILYHADENNSHLTYMTLIVLLILSQEQEFNTQMHSIILHEVTWYKEKALHDISLGGLIILVTLRMMQYNMVKMRDKYLHTNCLATIANMSLYFHGLSSYVCDRIFSFFIHLLKKYFKLSKKAIDKDYTATEEFADTNVLEEIIRMFLEIINCCLTAKLKDNPNLIYSILHEKDTFDQLQMHPKFQDIIFNINFILVYFNTRIESQSDQTISVDLVHEVIRTEIDKLPVDQFKKFPELRFKYMEEDQPEEFFVPYVWSLVYKSSSLHWDLKNVALFQLSPPKECVPMFDVKPTVSGRELSASNAFTELYYPRHVREWSPSRETLHQVLVTSTGNKELWW